VIPAERGCPLFGRQYFECCFEENTNLSWERIDRGWSALEKKFPDSLEALHIHGHLAGLAGDSKTAKKYLLMTRKNSLILPTGRWPSEVEPAGELNRRASNCPSGGQFSVYRGDRGGGCETKFFCLVPSLNWRLTAA